MDRFMDKLVSWKRNKPQNLRCGIFPPQVMWYILYYSVIFLNKFLNDTCSAMIP